MRAVRLLRLIKLGKVLGMSRILKRYEAHMDVTYALLSLIKMVFSIIAWSHLQALVVAVLVVVVVAVVVVVLQVALVRTSSSRQ